MNIFVLDTNPVIAASYHCDQHLHKMILESAQMLSTAAHSASYPNLHLYYKPSYQHHPCTQLLVNNRATCIWVIELCYALERIRESLDCPRHTSMEVIDVANAYMNRDHRFLPELKFIFTGPPSIEIRNLTIPQKYQMYYRQKHKQWLDTPRPMTYNNRPIPPFMADLFSK